MFLRDGGGVLGGGAQAHANAKSLCAKECSAQSVYSVCSYQKGDSHAMLADARQSHIALVNALQRTCAVAPKSSSIDTIIIISTYIDNIVYL